MNVYWLSFATRTPPHFFSQEQLFKMAGYPNYSAKDRRMFQALFRSAGVSRRAMWLDETHSAPTEDPDDFHKRYLSGVREIAPQVGRDALAKLGLQGKDLDFLVFSSCTGYSCPGFSTELAYTLQMDENRPTANLLGMGCSSMVPALARAHDYLVAYPGSRAMVISAEICSATYFLDQDLETALGNALFGDGAAAIVLSSREEDASLQRQNSPEFVARIDGFKTLRDGRFINDMGFTQKGGRLRVRLDRDIPERILPLVLDMVNLLELPAGSRVAFHPGGKRILDRIEAALQAGGGEVGVGGVPHSGKWSPIVDWSRTTLKNYGNMSSPTAAFVLEQSLAARPLVSGERGAIVTMGPGLSVEGMQMTWLRKG